MECGCLKTDNPFQGFPHGEVLLCCAAYLFSRKKLLCTSCGSCDRLVMKMTLTEMVFDLGEHGGYKLYRRTGECVCVGGGPK